MISIGLKACSAATAPVAQVRRAKLILLLDDGVSRDTIMNTLGCDSRFIATWRARFTEERLAGLYGRHPSRTASQLAATGSPCARLHAQAQAEGRLHALEQPRWPPNWGSRSWTFSVSGVVTT